MAESPQSLPLGGPAAISPATLARMAMRVLLAKDQNDGD